GQRTKVNLIHRLDFLGRDDHTRVREMLKLEPSIPVAIEESSKLPNKDPLKLYVVSEAKNLPEAMALWAQQWNKEQSAKHGRIEIVADPVQADISLVLFFGNDDPVFIPVIQMGSNGGDLEDVAIATSYLVSKDDQGLHVFWLRRAGIQVKTPETAAPFLGKELEKRLKARSK
ncbi:MAG TPA: hypothetical protein VFI57_06025, partial [Pyrinomonadaceae bacterium]|nr:hypothetical protein [Pyrinomonadaceae bacterium]